MTLLSPADTHTPALRLVLSSMAASVVAKDVNTFLSLKQNVADKELAAEWAQLEELYSKR